MEPEHIVKWERFKLPTEKIEEEDEDDYKTYKEDDDSPIEKLISSQQNPFAQLKTFNIWILHTNFWITIKILKEIVNFPGIESLDVVSPYRMYLAIGRAFDEEEIQEAFKQKLLELANGEQTLISE